MKTNQSNYERCPACGRYGWKGSHICPPSWQVRLSAINPGEHDVQFYSEQDYSFVEYRAKSAQEAAELFAKGFDEGDYDVVSGDQTLEVVVGKPSEMEGFPVDLQTFKVIGYSLPCYEAKLVPSKPVNQLIQE